MRSVVFVQPGTLEVRDRVRAELVDPSDAIVQVEACGICGTDLHIVEDPPGHPGTPGVIMGHEFVGHVVEVGSTARGIAVGDRVVVAPNVSCASCPSCKSGRPSACEDFSSLGIFRDGALAEYVSVPARSCYPIAADVPAPIAALTEPLSCVMNGVEQAKPLAGEVAVIFGAGAIGLLFLAAMRANGVRCIVVEPGEVRAATAERMGARVVRDLEPTALHDAVHAMAPLGADIVVDAVGSQLASAIEVSRTAGRVLLFGFNTRANPAIRQSDITRKELMVFGTWVGQNTFPPAIRLIESGLVDLAPIVSQVVSLEDTGAAFDTMRRGDAVKLVIQVQPSPSHGA
jgi:threonine dehydrogenase-like Zn-dependent dehydrogenase